MCKSVRGAAFFGSSIHLALSFVFLCWFVFDTLISEININLWKCDPPEVKFRDIDPLAHYLNVIFKLFYFVILFVTGVYIFRGVERERPQILKFATLGFVILQIIGIVLFSIIFTIQWNAEPESLTSTEIEAARLSAAEDSLVLPVKAPGSLPDLLSSSEEDDHEIEDVIDASPPENGSIREIVSTATTIVSENVLPAPNMNDTTTTTTPIPSIVAVTTTTTTTPATTTTAVSDSKEPSPCSSGDCSPKRPSTRRRLPHNQLVSLVLQMCFAVVNGIGSVVYVIVLALYMLKL